MIKTKSAEIINIDDNFDEAVQKAKKLYLAGSVFIYPTDTIYGFGANPFNGETVKRITEIKQRDENKRYIHLIDSIESLIKYVDMKSEKHLDFLLAIWPNPVSVVLKLNSKTSAIFGTETAAFRIPNNRFCQKLTGELKMPLISTSVNRSGQAPMIEYTLIEDEFSTEVDTIFYTGKKTFIEASTIIDLSENEPQLLREGKLKFKDLLEKFK